MKKFWSILLASMMILSMTACGGSETPASSSSSEAAPGFQQ